LVGKPARKRLLGRSRRRWEDNSKMYPQGMRLEGVDWIFLNVGETQLAGYSEHDEQPSLVFTVTPCISDIKLFIVQIMCTMLKTYSY
jgi:hypothetical protein